MRALAQCCLGPFCMYDGTIYEGQPILAGGDGTLRAHEPCIVDRLAEIGRFRQANADDPEALALLDRVEACLVRFQVTGSGVIEVGWEELAVGLELVSYRRLGGRYAMN